MNREYSRFARLYDWSVKFLPVWKTWLKKVLPHIEGPRVLEISFGTGYLMSCYAGDYDTTGLDYNERMVRTAAKNLNKKGLTAALMQGDVQSLPFPDKSFDTVINTMAFSGYPDGEKAIGEIARVIKPGGRLLLLDFRVPPGGQRAGKALVRFMAAAGDIIRDLPPLLEKAGFTFSQKEIGGFGSVGLFIGKKEK